MNYTLPRPGVCLLGALFIPAILAAQPTPAAPTKPEPANEKTVVLDPFEVRTTDDTGFAATTSVTRFNVDLDKLPTTADVMDKKFLDEFSAVTVEDLSKNYGAGGGFVLGTPETDSNSNQPGDYAGSGQCSIGGLSAAVPRRN